MEIHRCMKCMHELKPGQTVCPECGREYGSWKRESFALKPGTILNGTYLVGEMLGQGGFGITYIGWDLLLEQKVAIKEYFPMSTGLVSRENQTAVVWSSAMRGKTGVERGFDSFLKEARKMAKLKNIPNVVGVNSVFIQNETAYIVMDFIEGETMLKKLQREGPMDYDACLSLLTPIMQALAQVHKHGIIHRDISPDNIMVRQDGTPMLLDLGAAKDLDIQREDGTVQSSQAVTKQGFSPVEQYGGGRSNGPWTDVYAMAATVYYSCTGILPPPATDRALDDTLACQPRLTKAQFDALAACMAILPEKRPQSMDAMLAIIAKEPKAHDSRPGETDGSKPPKQRPTLPKWAILGAAGIAAVCIAIGIGTNKKQDPAGGSPTALIEETASAGLHVMVAAENLQEVDSWIEAEQYFWRQRVYEREDVETITFQSTLTGAPENAQDISEAGDKSVLAWMEGGDLYVAANGKIAPNPNASWLFTNFGNLKEIDFGDCFDTSHVTDMSFMFSGCHDLFKLDVTGFDTSSVTDMSDMFYGCASLNQLDVTGFDTGNVTDMGGMFSQCGSLRQLDVIGFDTSNVTDMHFMFALCENLEALDVTGLDTGNVTNMSDMFSYCRNLEELNVTGFDTSNVTIMRDMFAGCSSLRQLDVTGFDTSNVTDMSWMFAECSGLHQLDVTGFDTSNVTDMSYMFSYCSNLEELDVTGFDTANVTNIRWMFASCTGLMKLDLSGFDTSKVTEMQFMFDACTDLRELDVTGFDTSNVTDMSYMFSECSSLTDLTCTDKDILTEYRNR